MCSDQITAGPATESNTLSRHSQLCVRCMHPLHCEQSNNRSQVLSSVQNLVLYIVNTSVPNKYLFVTTIGTLYGDLTVTYIYKAELYSLKAGTCCRYFDPENILMCSDVRLVLLRPKLVQALHQLDHVFCSYCRSSIALAAVLKLKLQGSKSSESNETESSWTGS